MHLPTQDFPATLQATPDVDLGTGTGTPTTTGEWFNDRLHAKSELLLVDEFDPSVLGADEISHMAATLSVPNVIDHSGYTDFPSSNDIPYEYPTSAYALGNSLPIQGPVLDYIYHDKLAYLFQGLDFSYIDNGALSELTIPPPIMPSGAEVHDELPRLPDFSYSDNGALSELTIPPPIMPSGAALHDELPRLPDFSYSENGALSELTIPPPIVPSGSVLYDELPRLPDFSYSDNGALSELTIPPPIVPSGSVLYDELPRLPVVPDMQAATPQSQTTAPQILLPSLPNATAGGATTGTATSTSSHLTSSTAEQPKGPRRTTRQHVPSRREQALNDIGSSNARICTIAGVTEGKENDRSDFMSMKRKAKPTNAQANK